MPKEFATERGFTSIRKVFGLIKLLVLWLACECRFIVVVVSCVNVIQSDDERTNQICITYAMLWLLVVIIIPKPRCLNFKCYFHGKQC